MFLYGTTVNNIQEAREVCLEHARRINEEYAAKEAKRIEDEITNMPHFSRHEARFIAMGGVPCDSVSAFV